MPFAPQHTAQVILAECRLAGKTGIFVLSRHAFDQAKARNIGRADLCCAFSGVTSVVFQPADGTWLATGGFDGDGDPVSIAVVLRSGLLVITVF